MAIEAVNSTATNSNTSTAAAQSRKVGELGKDDFLQLLVTQLKYQDPLQPMEDKEFISQMAQFSSLEQIQNLNTNFSSMKAFSLMGKQISASYKDSESGEASQISGSVDKVKMQSGKVYVEVNGKDILVDEISDISDYTTSKVTDLMQLIGRNAYVTMTNEGGASVDATGKISAVRKVSGEDYARLDNVGLTKVEIKMPENTTQYVKDYLDKNVGKEITVIAEDKKGNKIEVTGTLTYSKQNGEKFDVILSNVAVPVKEITGIAE